MNFGDYIRRYGLVGGLALGGFVLSLNSAISQNPWINRLFPKSQSPVVAGQVVPHQGLDGLISQPGIILPSAGAGSGDGGDDPLQGPPVPYNSEFSFVNSLDDVVKPDYEKEYVDGLTHTNNQVIAVGSPDLIVPATSNNVDQAVANYKQGITNQVIQGIAPADVYIPGPDDVSCILEYMGPDGTNHQYKLTFINQVPVADGAFSIVGYSAGLGDVIPVSIDYEGVLATFWENFGSQTLVTPTNIVGQVNPSPGYLKPPGLGGSDRVSVEFISPYTNMVPTQVEFNFDGADPVSITEQLPGPELIMATVDSKVYIYTTTGDELGVPMGLEVEYNFEKGNGPNDLTGFVLPIPANSFLAMNGFTTPPGYSESQNPVDAECRVDADTSSVYLTQQGQKATCVASFDPALLQDPAITNQFGMIQGALYRPVHVVDDQGNQHEIGQALYFTRGPYPQIDRLTNGNVGVILHDLEPGVDHHAYLVDSLYAAATNGIPLKTNGPITSANALVPQEFQFPAYNGVGYIKAGSSTRGFPFGRDVDPGSSVPRPKIEYRLHQN